MKKGIEQQYLDVLQDILETGNKKSDRTGTGTLSKFSYELRHNMKDGFPLLTTKFVSWKTVFKELQWFLKGSTSLRDLLKVNVHIWDGDFFARYLKEVNKLEEPDYLLLKEYQDFEYLTTQQLFERVSKTQDETCRNYYDLEKFETEISAGSIKIENFEPLKEYHKFEWVEKNKDKFKDLFESDKRFVFWGFRKHSVADRNYCYKKCNTPEWKSKEVLDILRPFTIEEFGEQILTNDKFNDRFGDGGPIYGKQFRKLSNPIIVDNGEGWMGEEIDQIKNLLKDLKENPDSRRLIVSAWNVRDLEEMILSPCHNFFQCYTRVLNSFERFNWYCNNTESPLDILSAENCFDEFGFSEWIENWLEKYAPNTPKRVLSLKVNIRSSDLFLGLPYNIASYGFLLEMLALEINMVSEELILSLGDAHIYLNHIEAVKELLKREPKQLPKIKISKPSKENYDISEYEIENIEIVGYEYHPAIKAKLNN